MTQLIDIIARRVRQKRIARGLTQLELARRAGLSDSHIARLEGSARERNMPQLCTLLSIADVLGCELKELLPTRQTLRKHKRSE